MEALLDRTNNQLKQIVSKTGVVRNMLKLLIISNRHFAKNYYKYYEFSTLGLIARPDCGRFILPKQTSTQTRSLACLHYTKYLPISKANLPTHARAMNAVVGLSIQSWLSWCRLLHRKRPTYFDVFKRFLELQVSAKNAFTPSWHHPKFHGNDCGKGFGK